MKTKLPSAFSELSFSSRPIYLLPAHCMFLFMAHLSNPFTLGERTHTFNSQRTALPFWDIRLILDIGVAMLVQYAWAWGNENDSRLHVVLLRLPEQVPTGQL